MCGTRRACCRLATRARRWYQRDAQQPSHPDTQPSNYCAAPGRSRPGATARCSTARCKHGVINSTYSPGVMQPIVRLHISLVGLFTCSRTIDLLFRHTGSSEEQQMGDSSVRCNVSVQMMFNDVFQGWRAKHQHLLSRLHRLRSGTVMHIDLEIKVRNLV